ncbi:MAG: hypothetical protein LQ339_002491 [Xanthoria mediterranea]|nr:MAG: hypothetical protein LQ339_002491 [Xanthoria mediterranea]
MEPTDPHPFALQEIDDASAALILQLQREDAGELQRSSKGKNREDEVSDIDLAIELLQQDLQETNTFLMDRCMSRSLARAVVTDSACLTDEIARENSLANDRLVAERIQRGGEVECARGSLGDPGLDDLCIARLKALYVSGPTDERVSAVDDDEKDAATTALARPNSAMCVENAGRPALVINGTKIVWKLAQNKLSLANSLKDPCRRRSRQCKSNRPSKTYAVVTTAHMIAGDGFGGLISVRSATTIFHSGIDYEDLGE